MLLVGSFLSSSRGTTTITDFCLEYRSISQHEYKYLSPTHFRKLKENININFLSYHAIANRPKELRSLHSNVKYVNMGRISSVKTFECVTEMMYSGSAVFIIVSQVSVHLG